MDGENRISSREPIARPPSLSEQPLPTMSPSAGADQNVAGAVRPIISHSEEAPSAVHGLPRSAQQVHHEASSWFAPSVVREAGQTRAQLEAQFESIVPHVAYSSITDAALEMNRPQVGRRVLVFDFTDSVKPTFKWKDEATILAEGSTFAKEEYRTWVACRMFLERIDMTMLTESQLKHVENTHQYLTAHSDRLLRTRDEPVGFLQKAIRAVRGYGSETRLYQNEIDQLKNAMVLGKQEVADRREAIKKEEIRKLPALIAEIGTRSTEWWSAPMASRDGASSSSSTPTRQESFFRLRDELLTVKDPERARNLVIQMTDFLYSLNGSFDRGHIASLNVAIAALETLDQSMLSADEKQELQGVWDQLAAHSDDPRNPDIATRFQMIHSLVDEIRMECDSIIQSLFPKVIAKDPEAKQRQDRNPTVDELISLANQTLDAIDRQLNSFDLGEEHMQGIAASNFSKSPGKGCYVIFETSPAPIVSP